MCPLWLENITNLMKCIFLTIHCPPHITNQDFPFASKLSRAIFHPHDEPLLKYNYDDNQRIEPEWYIPIIPMVLVNGADGIGTGWSTKIQNYDPREIVRNLKKMINGEEPDKMVSWLKEFYVLFLVAYFSF